MKLPSLPPAQRLALLNACAAIYGVAFAAGLLPVWSGPPRPGQLPGLVTAIGIDAHAPFRFIGGMMLLPIILPLLLRPLLRRLAADETRTWARNAAAFAMLAPLWFVIIRRDPWWTSLPTAIALLILVACRRFDARFTRWDALLIPTFSVLFLGGNDAFWVDLERLTMCAAALLLALRLATAWIARRRGSAMAPALYFAAAPLGLLLQAHFNARDIRYNGVIPLILAIASPLLLAMVLRDTPAVQRRLRWSLAYAIYPLVIFGHMSATSLIAAEGQPRTSIFEDGHHLVPAHEMTRGEKPYRDIVPAHGFGQDAFIDYVMMRGGHDSVGEILKLRGVLASMGAVTIYAIVAVITRSPNAALLTFFLSAALGRAGGNLRSLPAVIFVALLAYALLRNRPRRFFWPGAMVAATTLISIDFGAYAFLTLVVMLFRVPQRLQSLRWSAIGVACIAGPAMLWFAVQGIADDYVRTTFFEVLTLGPVYTLTPFDAPPGFERFRFAPEGLLGVFDQSSFLYVMWALTVVLVGAAFAMPRAEVSERRRGRFEALLMIAVFSVITALSYAERHHLYHQFVIGPLLGTALFLMFRARVTAVRRAAPIAVLVAVMACNATLHLVIIAMVRGVRGPMEPQWKQMASLPRAAGALFTEDDIAALESAKKYVDRLPPGTTWFDFTNRGSYYYFFDRDCPVRHIEVAFYQTEERQRDVIARLEANRNVVAAMVPREPKADTVDGIPNAERAPLVWQYLQEHFEPEFEEGKIVFWRRR